MIIPIRCFTCNNKIANKWIIYNELLEKKREDKRQEVEKAEAQGKTVEKEEQILTTKIIEDIKKTSPESEKKIKSLIGQTLDEIGLTRYCCRRHFIGHIELIQYI